jgi:hypothetical protein
MTNCGNVWAPGILGDPQARQNPPLSSEKTLPNNPSTASIDDKTHNDSGASTQTRLGKSKASKSWLSERNVAAIAVGVLLIYIVERFAKTCHDEVLVPVVKSGIVWSQSTLNAVLVTRARRDAGKRPTIELPAPAIVLYDTGIRLSHVVTRCQKVFFAAIEFVIALLILYAITRWASRWASRKLS